MIVAADAGPSVETGEALQLSCLTGGGGVVLIPIVSDDDCASDVVASFPSTSTIAAVSS